MSLSSTRRPEMINNLKLRYQNLCETIGTTLKKMLQDLYPNSMNQKLSSLAILTLWSHVVKNYHQGCKPKTVSLSVKTIKIGASNYRITSKDQDILKTIAIWRTRAATEIKNYFENLDFSFGTYHPLVFDKITHENLIYYPLYVTLFGDFYEIMTTSDSRQPNMRQFFIYMMNHVSELDELHTRILCADQLFNTGSQFVRSKTVFE